MFKESRKCRDSTDAHKLIDGIKPLHSFKERRDTQGPTNSEAFEAPDLGLPFEGGDPQGQM